MRYGVISDLHSDVVNLTRVINYLKQQNIKQIFCCGDMVGYGNFPDAMVKIVKENNIVCVMGNHEKALFDEAEYNMMNRKAQIAIDENIDYLSDNDLDFLRELPYSLTLNNMRFVHGVPPNSYSNYLSYLDNADIKELFPLYTEQIAFCEHTHIQRFIEFDGKALFLTEDFKDQKKFNIHKNSRYIINVGSTSLPRNTTSEVSHFVIYDTGCSTVEFCEL